jgi:hydroxyacylglutathione hydrolase
MRKVLEIFIEDQPEPPKYFAMMKNLNKVDRPLLTEVPKLKNWTIRSFHQL